MKTFVALGAFAIAALCSGQADAADTLIYAHGWIPNGADLSGYNNLSYEPHYPWGERPDSINIAWDSGKNWTRSIVDAKTVLDSRCLRSASQSCTVVCHSTGCAIVAAALDIYGTVAGTPTWRVNRVLALASNEGGSEIATPSLIASFALKAYGIPAQDVSPTAVYLGPDYVRGAYDHHDTAGTPVFHVAGYDGGSYGSALLIPGQDDGVVSFHSACGYVKAFGATYCSNDWEWVRKTKWGVPYYVQRDVARWTNHTRTAWCGRNGCDKTHMQMIDKQFQDLALLPNP
jgi:hypothetical protein